METLYVILVGVGAFIVGGLMGAWLGFTQGVARMRQKEPWRRKLSIYETLYALIRDVLRRSEKANEGPFLSVGLYEEIQVYYEKNKLPIIESSELAGMFAEFLRLQPSYLRAYDTLSAPAGYAQLYPREAKEILRDICHVLEEEAK
jgi:hypothetical protein